MKRLASPKVPQWFSASIPIRLQMRNDLHLARKAWHMFMGLLVVAVYMAGVSKMTGIFILSFVLGINVMVEAIRLRNPAVNDLVLRYWGPIMRTSEINRFSGTPYYVASAIIAIAVFPKPIAALSILYLACGDPIASVFGISYGHKSVRLANGKSLIGSLAGTLTCALVTVVFLRTMYLGSLSADQVRWLTLFGAIAGGGAELLPLEVDDNFSIPIVSGFALWLGFIALGL